MLDLVFIILANSMAQILFALSVNRVYRMYGTEEGFKPVYIAEDMKWWEIFLYGIYKHNKVGRAFTTGLLVSAVSMIVCRQFALESLEVAMLHTMLLTTLYLSDKFHYLLPNTIVFTGFLVQALILCMTSDKDQLILNFVCAGIIFIIFLIVFILSLFTKEPMGGGDLKIMPFLTLWLGPKILIALPIALLLSMIYAIRKRKKSVALGPFLIIGAWIAILAAPIISRLLFQLIGGEYI